MQWAARTKRPCYPLHSRLDGTAFFSRIDNPRNGVNKMGLDMYLQGEKFCWTDWQNPGANREEDGLDVRSLRVKLGYWRKHPNLHGYIVKNFADGLDECQEIELDRENILQIMEAVKTRKLPETEGCFFGRSANNEDGEAEIKAEIEDDLKQLQTALDWLDVKEVNVSRVVIYRASW
jgi:hypothetical protein